jgi:AcrR family transcriptional regulator
VARREHILDAAVELSARHGYRGTGLLALAERVGISHVEILRHFGRKENLLRAAMARRDQILGNLTRQYQGTGIIGFNTIEIPFEPEILTRLEIVLRAENLDPDDPPHDYFEEGAQRAGTSSQPRSAQAKTAATSAETSTPTSKRSKSWHSPSGSKPNG